MTLEFIFIENLLLFKGYFVMVFKRALVGDDFTLGWKGVQWSLQDRFKKIQE